MKKIIVFYAWQSDTAPRYNRYLIRTALEAAARNINSDKDADCEVVIDSDTQGVPGTPPITDTILRKIEACHIFAPDLSFVARAENGKYIPNPNVMMEYGYALHSKTHAAMMPVMNTFYGPPEELPFDMGHLRHPIQYHVESTAKNAARRKARSSLIEKLEQAMRTIINAQGKQLELQRPPFNSAKALQPPALYFQKGESLAVFGFPEKEKYSFDGTAVMYLRICPIFDTQYRVGLHKMQGLFDQLKPATMSMTIGGIPCRNKYGPILIDPNNNNKLRALTQGFVSGELWGINSQVFRSSFLPQVWDEETCYVETLHLEKIFVRVLNNYIKLESDYIELPPPYKIELGLSNIRNYRLAVPIGLGDRVDLKGPIMENEIVRSYILNSTNEVDSMKLLGQFFNEIYDAAACSRADILTDQFTDAHKLPARHYLK